MSLHDTKSRLADERSEREERKRYRLDKQELEERGRLLSKKHELEMTILKRDSQQLDDRERYRRIDARLADFASTSSRTSTSEIKVKREPELSLSDCRTAGDVGDGKENESDDDSVVLVDERILDTCIFRGARLLIKQEPGSPDGALHDTSGPCDNIRQRSPTCRSASHVEVKRELEDAPPEERKGRRIKPSRSSDRHISVDSLDDLGYVDPSANQAPNGSRAVGRREIHSKRAFRDHHHFTSNRQQKKQKARHQLEVERDDSTSEDEGSDESRTPSSDESESEEAQSTADESDAGSDEEPEYTVHYAGPLLRRLSVEVLTQHLDRELGRGRLDTRTLADLARWWPKAKVAYVHQLDKDQVWLLTHGVTLWWGRLLDSVRKSTYRWPRSISSSSDRKSMRLRIEEIYCEKKKFSVRAEREMKEAGRSVSVSKVYRLGKI